MRQEDFLKNEAIAIQHCAARALCPFGGMCGAEPGDDARVVPALAEIPKGGLIWVNLRNEHRVVAIKEGLFVTVTVDGDEEEVFSIYGPGYCSGLAELYIDNDVCATYYLKALTDCTVCSFPAEAVRRRLESLTTAESNRIISCSLTNWAAASFELLKLYSHGRKDERVAMLLKFLREQSGRAGEPLSVIRLSHDELAFLLRSDRAAVTRALHGLEADGLVRLGYKTIALCDDFDQRMRAYADFGLSYHQPRSEA